LAAATEQSEPGPGCTNVPKGPTVCRDGSTVSVGGKTDEKGIREFIQYPLGKSPHSVPQDIGRSTSAMKSVNSVSGSLAGKPVDV
jgi:hypothetical protein